MNANGGKHTLLTTKDAAIYLGVSKGTLDNWRISGQSPPFVKIGTRIQYCLEDLDAWIDANKFKSTSQYAR